MSDLHPIRHKITEWEGLEHKKRAWNSRDLALAAMLAAFTPRVLSSSPRFSFASVQVRIVDALLPLSVLFGPPGRGRSHLGVFVGNFLGQFLRLDRRHRGTGRQFRRHYDWLGSIGRTKLQGSVGSAILSKSLLSR